MKAVALTAYPRTARGRNQVKKRRATGLVPASLYGRRTEARVLEVQYEEIEKVIAHSASEHILVDLSIDGEAGDPHLTLIQEVQHHPLNRKILHVDFHAVDPNEPVTVKVPVETVGEAVGVKAGGLLEHIRFEVELKGLPRELPEVLEVDVSNLNLDESLTIGQLSLPEGVQAVGDPNVIVVLVAPPRKETEEAEGEAEAEGGEEATQPEVITEKKTESDEG
jgi:large subunit ribosomal protein L25